MNFTCNECNDSGSRDKLGTYLDCNACDIATTRRDLNDFVKSLTQRSTYPVHPEDVALAIHQRALAMAPKQEAAGITSLPKWHHFVGEPSHRDDDCGEWCLVSDAISHGIIQAAPASANGALTDAKLPEKMSEEMREAMWEAITRHGAANLEYWIEDLYNDIRNAAIALSGAKGN